MTPINIHQALISFRSALNLSSSKDGSSSGGGGGSSNAFAKQVEKVQNTLLKGIFGGDDETFRDSLQLSPVLENGARETPPSQVDPAEPTPERFTDEMWRILGWDILAGDGADLL
jgi:hypothetical protein